MSDQYIVSARKYRPQTFDTVVGQEHITTTLKNAIRTQQLAHAYLFCGPRGVGKTSCARILARTINCENPDPDMEACGQCSTCQSFGENTSFNVFELDAASNNSVDDIRRLTEQVRYAPQHGKYKVYIIDEVHMLSSSAFNAFLKTLEEPPSYAIFILATTEKHKILPTILSRCQIFDFKRIQSGDIIAHLASICDREGMRHEEAALHIIAQKSEGCMRDALSMMDRIAGFSAGNLTYGQVVEHLNILDAGVYFKLSEMLLSKDISAALLYLDEVLQKGFEGDLILNGFTEYFRNLLLSKDSKMARLIDLPEEHKRNFFNHAQLVPQAYVLSALSLLNDAEITYRNALNKRLHMELALIRLCYLNDLVLPADTSSQAEKKNLIDEPAQQYSAITHREKPETGNLSRQEELHPLRSDEEETPAPEASLVTETKEDKKDSPIIEEPLPPQAPRRKLSRNILSRMHEEVISQSDTAVVPHLTQELAKDLFRQFRDHLRHHPQELPAVAQLEMMQIKCIATDELQLVCNSEINVAYGQNKSDDFRTFCIQRTKIKNLRITTFLDKSLIDIQPTEKILSKLEVFEVMSDINPNLKVLKNALNLNVEF